MPNIKFPLAFSTWNHEENDAINNLLKTGHLTMGKEVSRFEKGSKIFWF